MKPVWQRQVGAPEERKQIDNVADVVIEIYVQSPGHNLCECVYLCVMGSRFLRSDSSPCTCWFHSVLHCNWWGIDIWAGSTGWGNSCRHSDTERYRWELNEKHIIVDHLKLYNVIMMRNAWFNLCTRSMRKKILTLLNIINDFNQAEKHSIQPIFTLNSEYLVLIWNITFLNGYSIFQCITWFQHSSGCGIKWFSNI